MLTAAEQKALARFEERIRKNRTLTAPPAQAEDPAQRRRRVEALLGNFEAFCKYYFPQFWKADLGWFHRKAAREIVADPDIFAVLEWPRGHAKSVFADVFIPLYLKARGELSGMIVVSSNQDKADKLLMDLQVELESNQRYIADFGPQCNFGRWQTGQFITNDGLGFWAFGRGQSPRGVREGGNRPNFIVLDDVDDDKLCKNEEWVDEAVEWVEGALIPCMGAEGGRLLVVGNRIHRKSILAKLVGDVEEGQKPRAGICHIKVFATENPKTHKEDQSERTGVPAWKEYWTWERLRKKWSKMRTHMVQREYYHHHYVLGKVFRREWLNFVKIGSLTRSQYTTSYNDPSWKGEKSNDYKAIIAIRKLGLKYQILDIFCRQVTRSAMVKAHYDQYDRLRDRGADSIGCHYEANAIQDLHGEAYQAEAQVRGYHLPVRQDTRKKANKEDRIERLAGFFERGLIEFDERLRNTPDYAAFEDQLLGFPGGKHDDGPDALEGAITIIEDLIRLFTPEAHSTGGSRRDNRW